MITKMVFCPYRDLRTAGGLSEHISSSHLPISPHPVQILMLIPTIISPQCCLLSSAHLYACLTTLFLHRL